MKVKILFCLILVVLLAGCANNEPGVGARVRLNVRGVSELGTLNGRTTEATGSTEMITGLVFNEVLLGVEELEFERMDDDGGEDHDNSGPDDGEDDDGDDSDPSDGEHDDDDGDNEEIEFEGAFIVDLIAGTSTPDFGVTEVVPGAYEEIEIKLSPILPDGNSVFVSFSFVNAEGDTVQTEISTKKQIEIEIEDDDGFQIEENLLNSILVLIDLDKLISGIDLSQATVDDDGVIRINDSSNALILSKVLSNFNDSCHGGEDDDHDGDIDDD